MTEQVVARIILTLFFLLGRCLTTALAASLSDFQSARSVIPSTSYNRPALPAAARPGVSSAQPGSTIAKPAVTAGNAVTMNKKPAITASSSPTVFKQSSTGIIASFPGSPELGNYAYSYDQAIAANYFLANKNYSAAGKTLAFFENIRKSWKSTAEGQNSPGVAFQKAFNSTNGAISDPVIATGPNAWLGIAALNYTQSTKKNNYLPLAKDIGTYLVSLDQNDGYPGIVTAPGSSIRSTEENIDTSAFLKRLATATGDAQYRTAAGDINTFVKSMYNPATGYFNAGMNGNTADTRFATDVQTMAILALGVDGLAEIGVDVENLLAVTEARGTVQTTYTKPDGATVSITGFGFQEGDNKISVEWTAQMIVAYLAVSKEYTADGNIEKASYYKNQAAFYLNELKKMSSNNALPYATAANSPTGFGWDTPTSSVSLVATAYYNLAVAGDNPFTPEFDNLWK
jgi:hypothetical protein